MCIEIAGGPTIAAGIAFLIFALVVGFFTTRDSVHIRQTTYTCTISEKHTGIGGIDFHKVWLANLRCKGISFTNPERLIELPAGESATAATYAKLQVGSLYRVRFDYSSKSLVVVNIRSI